MVEEFLSKYFPIKQTNVRSDAENAAVATTPRLNPEESNLEGNNSQQQTVEIQNTSVILEVENFQQDEEMNSSCDVVKQQVDIIRKWKVGTELRLEQTTRLLEESTLASENQRKVILDLQFENENLNSKLREEMKNREEAAEKFCNFYRLMENVKKHYDCVLRRAARCEQVKDHVGQKVDFFKSQIDALTTKFSGLNTKYRSDCDELKKHFEAEVQKTQAVENKLQCSVESYEEQVSVLKIDTDAKLKDNEELLMTIQTLNLKLAANTTEHGELNTKMEEMLARVETLQSQLKAETEKLEIEKTTGEKNKKEVFELNAILEVVSKEKEDAISEKNKIHGICEEAKRFEESTVVEVKMSLEKLEVENQQAKQDLESKIEEMEEVKAKLRAAEEKSGDVIKEKIALDETIENLEKSNSELKDSLGKLQFENWNNSNKTQKQSEKYIATIDKLDKEIENLKAELEKSTRENEKLTLKVTELSTTLNRVVAADTKTKDGKGTKETKKTNDRKRRVTFSPLVSTNTDQPPAATSITTSDDVFDQLLRSSPQIPSTSKKIRSYTANKAGGTCYGRARANNERKKGEVDKMESHEKTGDVYDIFHYPEDK